MGTSPSRPSSATSSSFPPMPTPTTWARSPSCRPIHACPTDRRRRARDRLQQPRDRRGRRDLPPHERRDVSLRLGRQHLLTHGVAQPRTKSADDVPSPIRLGPGSGSTPSLMGTKADDDRFVVITDGQALMHLVLFWRDEVPDDWEPIAPGKDPRIACEIAGRLRHGRHRGDLGAVGRRPRILGDRRQRPA